MPESFRDFFKRVRPPKKEIPTKEDYLKADESYPANIDTEEKERLLEEQEIQQKERIEPGYDFTPIRESGRHKETLAEGVIDDKKIFNSLNSLISENVINRSLEANVDKKIREIADSLYDNAVATYKSKNGTVIPSSLSQNVQKLITWKLILMRSDKPEHESKFKFHQAVEEAEKNIKEIESKYIA